MNKFIPNMYKESIFKIDYDKLKKIGIKVLLFDFDNTIIEKGNYIVNEKAVKLLKTLKKEFVIYVVSNSIHTKKLKKVCENLDVPYIKNSGKPFKRGFKKLKLKDIKPMEIAMIGDQIITDVWGSKRMNYYSVLIDPINNDELLFTKINRIIERIILKKNKMVRGKYYDQVL